MRNRSEVSLNTEASLKIGFCVLPSVCFSDSHSGHLVDRKVVPTAIPGSLKGGLVSEERIQPSTPCQTPRPRNTSLPSVPHENSQLTTPGDFKITQQKNHSLQHGVLAELLVMTSPTFPQGLF